MCGLQQLIDWFSQNSSLYMEFFTVDPPFAEHRGFHIEATFDDDFVDISTIGAVDQRGAEAADTACLSRSANERRSQSSTLAGHRMRRPLIEPWRVSAYYIFAKLSKAIPSKNSVHVLFGRVSRRA